MSDANNQEQLPTGTTPAQQPAGTTTVTPNPEQQTFTLDYVKALREEAKNNRLASKTYETKLRGVLGLTPEADLTNLDEIITGHKSSVEKRVSEAMVKANDTLVKAELKALGSTHNVKLLEKLVDKTKLTIENGEVKGLTELLTELETEFPEIKKQVPNNTGFNPAGKPPAIDTSKMNMEEYMEAFAKRGK